MYIQVLYVLLYVGSRMLYRKLKQPQVVLKTQRYRQKRMKILIVGIPLAACILHSLNIYRDFTFNNEKIAKGILLSAYMSTLLYIGPIYQEVWNGKMRRKLAKLSFNKFRWDYFTKIVMMPAMEEIIFRGLIYYQPQYDDITFIISSTLLFTFAKVALAKNKLFEGLYALILGAYLGWVLTKTGTIISVIINHGYLNFMGRPNLKEIFLGDVCEEVKQKTVKFYVLGILAFIVLIIVL